MTTQQTKKLEPETRNQLLDEAASAANNAYVPYSEFRVGAAVLGASGSIFRGANVENSCYGLGTCAERVALATAFAAGERNIVAIAIACVDVKNDSPLALRAPCGACRQWIQELAPKAEIMILGEERTFAIEDFLPLAFSLKVQQIDQ